MTTWNNAQSLRDSRKRAGAPYAQGKCVARKDTTALLEAVIRPGDRVCLEGDNQKQADLLATALAAVNKDKVHDLHMVQSGVVLPEHLDLFELGIAKRLDYAYSGPQSQRIAKLLFGGKIELGAVHTYLELFARYYVDLTPQVALIAAVSADREGNLYTGPNTEDTPAIVEATAFKDGIVIAQVNEIVDKLPRVDIPGDWVDFVIESGKPFYVEPLFTRDPGAITETQILTAMLAIKGIYAPYGVQRLNHGIDRAATTDLWRASRAERKNSEPLGAQSTSHVDPRDRVGLGAADPQFWFGSRDGRLHTCSPGCIFYRPRWIAAFQSCVFASRRSVCL
jgi:malonate decarboxylase alpha subunit